MKIITKIISFIVIVFTINIIFYYISDDYRFFIKKVKNKDTVVYTKEETISDEIIIEDVIVDEIDIEQENQEEDEEDIDNKEDNDKKISKDEIKTEKEIRKEVVLGLNYRKILEAFSSYGLKELENSNMLFDITNEYPDEYYEYYSDDLSLYFFTTKSYDDVKNIIEVIAFEVPYEINEVNNFLDKSFYINLDEVISDNDIRIVIGYKSITFGLKIKKDVYNDVKDILLNIDKQDPLPENNKEEELN